MLNQDDSNKVLHDYVGIYRLLIIWKSICLMNSVEVIMVQVKRT